MKKYVAAIGALTVWLFAPAAAEAICPMTQADVRGQSGAGCEASLLWAAKRHVIRECLGEIQYGSEVLSQVDEFASDSGIVASASVVDLENADGACRGRVRVIAKDQVLARKVARIVAGRTNGPQVYTPPVGVVVRTVIDGKVAEEAGFETMFEIQKLEQQLLQQGLNLVALPEATYRFAKGIYTVAENLQNVGKKAQPVDKGRSFVDLRDETREAVSLARRHLDPSAPEYKNFEWLLAGELHVRSAGRDAQSGQYLKEVTGYLRILHMSSNETIAATASKGRGKGANDVAALSDTVVRWVEGRAPDLGRKVRDFQLQSSALGKEYGFVILGATSVRKQVRPVVKAFEAAGFEFVGPWSDKPHMKSSKGTVRFKGNRKAFGDAVDAALDRLEPKFPNIDSRMDAGTLEIKL